MTTNKVTAKLNYLHIAPRKVRLVVNALKGLSTNEAEAQLLFRPKRSSQVILKLLRSAIANAKNNHKMKQENLFIESIQVNQGPTLKRSLPRAMGRATPLHKKMSHIILTLGEKEKPAESRFNIPALKRVKTPKKEKAVKKTEAKTAQKNIAHLKSSNKPGFFRKIFNRKSI